MDWINLVALMLFTGTTLARDYCIMDTFEAACPDVQVVVMTSALYGRMEMGTCVLRNFGYVGCSSDVLHVLDSRCSGRHACSMSVASSELEAHNTCEKEFKSYLSAEYICQSVLQSGSCVTPGRVRIPGNQGNLSSALSASSGCGGETRPWYIEARPGQNVVFTLYDFSVNGSRVSTNICNLYAVIKEPGNENRETICGGRERVSTVYTSVSNAVEVRMLNRNNLATTSAHFLLEYTVTGCEDLVVPITGATVERFNDVTYIQCPGDKKRWKLTCTEGVWSGKYHNCTVLAGNIPEYGSITDDSVTKWLPFSIDISIVLVLSVAITISCLIFVVGIFVIRRQNLQCSRQRREAMMLMEREGVMCGGKYPPACPQQAGQYGGQGVKASDVPGHLLQQHREGTSGRNTTRLCSQASVENDYAYIADFPGGSPPSPKPLRKIENKTNEHVATVAAISGSGNNSGPGCMSRQSKLPLKGNAEMYSRENALPYGLSASQNDIIDQRKSL